MIKSEVKLEILTLGRFSIALNGKPVAKYWPEETIKVLFCCLLSPLDLNFSWDRICRSMLDVPDSQQSRQQLDELIIRPLKKFLIMELGFNPLITEDDNLRIDQRRINVDAFEFLNSAVEGLKQLSHGNYGEALQKLDRARLLYRGAYLPGVEGKIITNTRNDLELLYQKVVSESTRQMTRNSAKTIKRVHAY